MFNNSSLPGIGLADHLALVIDGLCRAVAARAAGNPLAAPLLVLLWGRLRRVLLRFARAVAEVAAGVMPLPRVRLGWAATASRDDASFQPRLRFPSGFAWLMRFVPEAASYGSQLRHLLLRPEMVALLAAAPRLERMFAPLRRMLGVEMGTWSPRPARLGAIGADSVPRAGEPAATLRPAAPAVATDFYPPGSVVRVRHAGPEPVFQGREPPKRAPPVAAVKWRGLPAVDRSD